MPDELGSKTERTESATKAGAAETQASFADNLGGVLDSYRSTKEVSQPTGKETHGEPVTQLAETDVLNKTSQVFGQEVKAIEPLDADDKHANDAYKLRLSDGTSAVYKPVEGEQDDLRESIPDGGMASREIAASALDRHLKSGLVPETGAWIDGPRGDGSVQRWVDGTSAGKVDVAQYSREEVQRMAVHDYVSANLDRHGGNYRTDQEGRLVAIDHGCSFPEGSRDEIRSDFVVQQLGLPLDRSVLADVRAVNASELREDLRRAGLSQIVTTQALNRLDEIQKFGRITGDIWRGKICDANWSTWREARS